MNLKDLISSVNYKSVFNIVYKEYYKDKKYSNSKMMDVDYAYSKVFENLKSKEINKEEKPLSITFQIHENEGDKFVDTCLYDEDKDELMALDFVSWDILLGYNINNSLNLSPEEMAAHLLWEITFWGFTEDKIKKEAEAIEKHASESSEWVEVNLDDLIK